MRPKQQLIFAMSGGSDVPRSNVAVGSLVSTSSVNSRVTISRPVVTSGMVLARIQSGNTAGGPSTHPQPGAQNVAAALQACLTRHLLEQANSILQRRATNLMPAQSSSAAQGVAPAPQPTQKASPNHSFRVRVFNPDCKKQYDTLMLRDIAKESMNSPLDLKKEIWKQFGSEVVSSDLDFAVGYMKGNSKLSIISAADVDDVWGSVKKRESIRLWCDRVRVQSKRKIDNSESNSDSDDSSDVDTAVHKSKKKKKRKKKKQKLSAMEERNGRIENNISSLREKHGDKFTMIQYRMWSELIDNGKHRWVASVSRFLVSDMKPPSPPPPPPHLHL